MFAEATTTQSVGALTWDTDGYYKLSDQLWKDVEIQATMVYQDQEIGIIPRLYSPYAYLYFRLKKNTQGTDSETQVVTSDYIAEFNTYMNEEEVQVADPVAISNLVVGQSYQLKVSIQGSNFKAYLDGEKIFDVEYNLLTEGSLALYATATNQCSSVDIASDFPLGWTSNVGSINHAIVRREEEGGDHFISMNNPDSIENLYIKQDISVGEEKNCAISFEYQGNIVLTINELDGLAPQTHTVNLAETFEFTKAEQLILLSSDCTSIEVIFSTPPLSNSKINNIQLEPGIVFTSYIHNDDTESIKTRESSFLTYPAQQMRAEEGTISFWFKPNTDYTATNNFKPVFIEYGDQVEAIRLYGEGGNLVFQHGSNQITYSGVNVPLLRDNWYHIAATWDDFSLSISVNGDYQMIEQDNTFNTTYNSIQIGHSTQSYETPYGTLDDLIIYKKALVSEEIIRISQATEKIENTDDMVLRAAFDYTIGNFNRASMEVSNIPEYGSPIIVEKADGTTMRKVSFVDKETGDYITHNTEVVFYDGFSDYIEVSFDDLDTTNFKIKVTDIHGASMGDPYKVVGKRIYLTIMEEEKEKYKETPLYIHYQLENSYTVDFNTEIPDAFRIQLGKHDGQEIGVSYEGNRFSHEKLADMIELNPLLNPKHKGFLYISNQLEEISTFRIKLSPNHLYADGISDSLLIIEPLDQNGNHISNAQLEVRAKHGEIIPMIDVGSIRLREVAGRYIYRYRAPYKQKENFQEELIDKIKIRDKKSGIGTESHMTLLLENEYYQEYDPVVSEIEEERMAAYLLNQVMEHYKKSIQATDSLYDLLIRLDFNQDNEINLEEIVWLNENLRTQDLKDKYYEIKQWHINNQ